MAILEAVSVASGGRLVVRGATLTVPRGEITMLLGPNGAGNSSLVLAVAGVVRPAEGSIRAGDLELAGRRPEQIRQVEAATVPEGHRVLGDLSVGDNIRVAAAGLPRRARAAAPGGRHPPDRAVHRARRSGFPRQRMSSCEAAFASPRPRTSCAGSQSCWQPTTTHRHRSGDICHELMTLPGEIP